jgi:hypothetical protein
MPHHAAMVAWCSGCVSASQQGSDIKTASRVNRAPLQSFTNFAAITRPAAMADFDRLEQPEDRKALRRAAVDTLRDAARQTDPREFSRLTRHALALIERARAIGHGRQHSGGEALEAQGSQKNDAVRPGLWQKIAKCIARQRRL